MKSDNGWILIHERGETGMGANEERVLNMYKWLYTVYIL